MDWGLAGVILCDNLQKIETVITMSTLNEMTPKTNFSFMFHNFVSSVSLRWTPKVAIE